MSPGPRRQSGLHRAGRPPFADALKQVTLAVHLGLYDDETAARLRVARPRGALPGKLGRRPRPRRHRRDPAAADRAAVRRPVGDRVPRRFAVWIERRGRRHRSQSLAEHAGAIPPTSTHLWEHAVRAGSSPRPRLRPRRQVALAPDWAADSRAGRRRLGTGDAVSPRPDALRRPVRQQRLAPGTAQAGDQADLGQCRAPEPGHGRRGWASIRPQPPRRAAWRRRDRRGRAAVSRAGRCERRRSSSRGTRTER